MSGSAVGAGNLFADLPGPAQDEAAEPLLDRPGLRIVRIVSHGQATPPGDWYDQDEDEWVVVLSGAAGVTIEGEGAPRALGPGDWLFLPAHCRHRVEWTSAEEPTCWLAVHIGPAEPAGPRPS